MSAQKKRIFMVIDIEGVGDEQALEHAKKVKKQMKKWLGRKGVVQADTIMQERRGNKPLDLSNMKIRTS